MSTRRAKQLIYGALYVVLLIIFFAVIYFLVKLFTPAAPVTTECTTDCMPVGASSISTSTVWSFVTSPGHYTFLDEIVNTNADYAAEYFAYNINLYDASGTLVQSIPNASFAYANQAKYLVVPNQVIPSDENVASVGISISNVEWVSNSAVGEVPVLTQQSVQTNVASTTLSVAGQLTNTDISTLQYIYVDVIFKGSDGAPVGASQTVLNNVGPGQTVNFSVMYPAISTISNPASNEVFAYGLRD
jgi:hypothetical protein